MGKSMNHILTQYASRITHHVSRFTLPGLFVYALFAGVAYSQDITVSAGVTPKIINLNEMATLRVTLSGNTQFSQIAPPRLKSLPAFEVSYSGSSSQYNLIGNQISVSMTWSYLLRPEKVGRFTVPEIHITYGRKTYTTDPITIKVLPKSQKPSRRESSPNAFTDTFSGGAHKVEASVDNSRPYVNEQITYAFRYLYNARIPGFNSPQYAPPPLTRFWEKDLERKRRQRQVIDGTPYWVEEIQVALFPITAGKVTIEPAKLSLPISRGFGRINSPSVLVADAIEVDVRPLPQAGKPANFTGAVGQYQIHTQAHPQTIKAGDGFTLRLQVSGQGNIETLTPPVIPTIPNMTIYDPKITDSIGEVDSKIQGNRTYEYVIIPSEEGNWTIPAIEYPYFHPQKESYHIARTVPITITVLPNPDGATRTTTTQVTHSEMHLLKQDIRYIKPDSLKLTDRSAYPYRRASFWIAQILPVIVVLFVWFYQQQQARRDPKQLRQQNAAKRALKTLEEAEKQIENGPAAFFAALATGLYQYVGDIFDISPGGLNPELARQRCEAGDIPESSTTRFVDMLTRCDYVRFAPVAANPKDMENALNHARGAIHEIEKERQLKT